MKGTRASKIPTRKCGVWGAQEWSRILGPRGGAMNGTRKVFQAAWRAYAQRFPTQFEPKHEALEFSCTGISVPLFNLAFPKTERPIGDTECDALLQEFRSVLTPLRIPGLLMARTDLLETATLDRALFRMPGMVGAELLPAQRLLPQEEIQEVCGEAMAAEIARLNAAAHELTEQEADQLSRKELWGGPSHGFLIYQDGQAVAGGAVTYVEGVSYIGWMATKEGYRGRGYAEAILRYMDTFMRERYGVKESVLHATQMGLPLYERLGYRTVDEFAAILCMPAAGAATA